MCICLLTGTYRWLWRDERCSIDLFCEMKTECTEQTEPGWRRDELALLTQCFLSKTQPPPILHCFTLNFKCLVAHTRGLKIISFALESTCEKTLILGLLWNGCEAFRGPGDWGAVRRGFSAVCPSLLTLLDGRAAPTSGDLGTPPDRTAPPTNVCLCNCVHSRQTHAVTFWLCSSIVVAIFVTFWNYSLFGYKDID